MKTKCIFAGKISVIMRYNLSFVGVLLFAACGTPEQGEMKLRYDQPATFFEEALPIGNGRLGAMVYGGTRQDKLSLNDITLWTGEPEQKADHVYM